MDIRLAALRSMRRLLPRMHLAGYSSSIMHPLIRCLPQLPPQLMTQPPSSQVQAACFQQQGGCGTRAHAHLLLWQCCTTLVSIRHEGYIESRPA